METSFKYIMVKLDSITTFTFSIFYFFIDAPAVNVEDRIRILTGLCISTFYIVKTIRYFETKTDIQEIKKRLEKLENHNTL